MAIYVIAMSNLIYLGVMGWLVYDGLRVGIFGGGYRLIGGRESFGWGARVAGFIMALPLPASIVTWTIILASGGVTLEEIRRGDHNALAMALTAVVAVICYVVSYIFAEATLTPYWLYLKKTELAEQEEDDEEDLDERQKDRRKKKLEKKLERAREREEEKRRMLEQEQERMQRRHEQAKAGKMPPPIPDDDDDDEYYRRRGRR